MARVLERVITDHPRLAGTYHIAAAPISKYDLLDRLNRLAGLPVEIDPVAEPAIDRSLDGSRFAVATGINVPAWDEMLRELIEKRESYHA
jgi:dTDP-4-dehydrorhamnose reductase